ncbi:hypothetical protein FHR81_003711 [Actinoalloteichus hoggarensis]|uniref:Uncharacterized protein n=1 Tax=Actinoalloteichus hoggarensis TaxID=1470176 RepID=A0A221WC29_9PSEU|nr:hypothetical protein AHOG_27255 [Actinoalloteichus hoggarensis]MBB5922654.1 hypothetical protein [Actinoalloteichus hoggarensis]
MSWPGSCLGSTRCSESDRPATNGCRPGAGTPAGGRSARRAGAESWPPAGHAGSRGIGLRPGVPVASAPRPLGSSAPPACDGGHAGPRGRRGRVRTEGPVRVPGPSSVGSAAHRSSSRTRVRGRTESVSPVSRPAVEFALASARRPVSVEPVFVRDPPPVTRGPLSSRCPTTGRADDVEVGRAGVARGLRETAPQATARPSTGRRTDEPHGAARLSATARPLVRDSAGRSAVGTARHGAYAVRHGRSAAE